MRNDKQQQDVLVMAVEMGQSAMGTDAKASIAECAVCVGFVFPSPCPESGVEVKGMPTESAS